MGSPEDPAPGPLTMEGARHQVGPHRAIVGVIGSPVAHSLSPALHNAAFVALGIADQWRSFAFEVPTGGAAGALESMRYCAVAGLSVTMPHKEAVAALVDECSDTARRLHAVNCVHARDGLLYGANTDGEGFVAALRRGAAFEPAGRRCLVVGAGGAARAVIDALSSAGASRVAVLNRTPARATSAAALAGVAGSVVDPEDTDALARTVAGADLVVNATPVGMAGVAAAATPRAAGVVPPGMLHAGQVAADLIYAPRPTPWLVGAASAGATALDGLGMLVHQAAAQLALWTGLEPPLEAMWRAAEEVSPPTPARTS